LLEVGKLGGLASVAIVLENQPGIMHIFIDESGAPAIPSGGGHNIFVVGGLIVPDCRLAELFRRYARVRRGLGLEGGEAKGRLQDERGVANVVDLLIKNGALFEATAIDMGDHTEADLIAHKQRQEEAITNNLTDEHHPSIQEGAWALRRRLAEMSPQLYVQAVVTFELIWRAVEHSTLYFSQRIPAELGAFHWVVDSKERAKTTDWEDWWSYVVMPALESQSRDRPFGEFEDGDYSHFARFHTIASDHHVEALGLTDHKVLDANRIMTESFRFSPEPEPGLELVDVVTNATRRSLSGRLTEAGWHDIPRLMIHRRQHYVQLINLVRGPLRRVNRPYGAVLRHFARGGKDMLAPRFRGG
jgi:hypothetical protein